MTYLGVNYVLNAGVHSYGMGDSPEVLCRLHEPHEQPVFLRRF
jgi:hypothetical protein